MAIKGHKGMIRRGNKGAAGTGLSRPVTPSPELAPIVGSEPLPRSEVVSKLWQYIRTNNLQNPENKREIIADEKLRKVFGKDRVTMFEMNKHISKHVAHGPGEGRNG